MNTTLYNLSYCYDNVTHDPKFRTNKYSFDFQFEFPTDVIFNIMSAVIAVLGVIGNFVTIVMISYQSRFHTPTFVAIKCLAVSDFFGTIAAVFEFFTNVLFLLQHNAFSYLYLFDIINLTVYLCSLCHVLLLCAVRYLLVVHPLDSRQYLTVTVVSLGSLTSWVLCFVFVGIYIYLVSTFENKKIVLAIDMMEAIFEILYLIIAAIIIILMHFKKVVAIKKSSTQIQIQTKLNFIASVMIFFIFLCRIIDTVVDVLFVLEKTELITTRVRKLYIFFSFFIYSYNPYILFVFSCLKSCKKKVHKKLSMTEMS